ncbi:two-component system sensor histidine kinase YesM [Hydrogenispora ethanolica]|uniref:histidine kinase n=2 Tax=Hydrogenispora ethanolica TaxID=1082276 RepID=A0A4R1R2Y4_HYDET|nr:two-component system sensor histidine kinase YesM [Hydrogenispora ethanolica]
MMGLSKQGLPGLIRGSLPFKRFEQLSLRNKLLISFIFVSIIPILLAQTLSYYNSTVSMQKKINDLIHFNLVQTAKNLDTTLTSYEDLVIQIFSDENIIEQVKKLNSGSDVEQLLARVEIRRKFSIISLSKPGVRCISILAASGQVAWYDRVNNSGIQNIWSKYPDVTQTEVYRSALRSDSWVLTAPDSDRYRGKDYHYVNIALRLVDWNSYSDASLGVIVLSVDEAYLYNSCNRPFDDPNRDSSFNFVYDRRGRLIAFPLKQYLGRPLFRPGRISGAARDGLLARFIRRAGVFGERNLIINRFQDQKQGWTIVNAIDRDYLFKQMYWMQRLTILFGILTVLFSVLIITYVTSALTHSIKKIVAAMQSAREGELSVQVNLDTKDEIAMIGSHFNQMMARLQQLLEEVKVATGRQKEAEIRALAAQINPHFLYNMLDSINWMAIEKDEHAISRMIESLANILRYSTNDSSWEVSLREEIDWLQQYLFLQQNHFENSFESILRIEPAALDCRIYKLLLQPLVENAIVHGFKGYTAGGVMTICAGLSEGFLKITIQDNGRGIPAEILDAIDRELQEPCNFNGIGIRNVARRLRTYYGAAAGLSFESRPGAGTLVTLWIPAG